MVVNVHGGPRGRFTDSYSPLTNLPVGKGWAVLVTNPRGSTGYGVEFEAANKGDMGNGDYLDIMAGVDEVLHTSPVDPDRMALIGYSYGGEMAAFVEGKTTRFKAIVSGTPAIDQFNEYGTESSMGPNRVPTETAGIRGNRGATSKAHGGKALWPMSNTRRRPLCSFKAGATRRIPKVSQKRCTAHYGKRACRCSCFSFHAKTTARLAETLQGGRAPSHGPA
jgi:poly(3-hydroxybutyrate) depolymerase